MGVMMPTTEKLFPDEIYFRPVPRALARLDQDPERLPPLLVRAMVNACPLDPSKTEPTAGEVNSWLCAVHHVGLALAEIDRREPIETQAVFRMAVGLMLDEVRPGWRPDAWGNWGRL